MTRLRISYAAAGGGQKTDDGGRKAVSVRKGWVINIGEIYKNLLRNQSLFYYNSGKA